jgi:hypothetical protein
LFFAPVVFINTNFVFAFSLSPSATRTA